jgi:TonB family protein
MGKVVKYCSACEEGFAEKFGFCPNCGANLTAFEMNPLGNTPPAEVKTEPVQKFEETTQSPIIEAPAETSHVSETRVSSAPEVEINEPVKATEAFEFGDDVFEEPAVEEAVPATKSFEAPQPVANETAAGNLYEASYAKAADATPKEAIPHYEYDGGYQPTIVVEKNVKQRNTLLLGAFALGCMLMLGSYVYSMFNKYLDIAAIETPDLLSYIGEVDPTPIELEEQPKKNDDKGGGGGGGGKEEPTPASKGREATQVDNPMFAPSISYTKVTNPDIPIQAATKGNRQAEQTDEPYGLKNGGNFPSDGDGSGGGQGSGRGRGQGGGNGDGLGNGNGSGYGNGNGNGNGDGDGDGDGDRIVVKKPTPIGPTEGVKILSKPRANYTDAARQNQVQGKVVLRVTFSANGSIGAISVISGLGNGLTEQAIAAARGIRFEPAKRGGVPYSVTKPVEYTFTIY